MGGFAILPAIFMLFVGVLSLACFGFWLWMLIDCLSNEPSNGNDKIVWMLLIIFLPFLGSLLYFFVRRPQRQTEFGR